MRYAKFALVLVALLAAVSCGGQTDVDQPGEVATDELDFSQEPNYGGVELYPGFDPDPYTVDIVSGGAVDVATLGIGSDCSGYATTAPDFRVVLDGDSEMVRIFFVPDDPGHDATLIVSDPDGDWLCNDDYSGWDPMVVVEPAEAGTYDIWVGSYSTDELILGTLYITELDYEPGDVE
jgi:hypothetical protein